MKIIKILLFIGLCTIINTHPVLSQSFKKATNQANQVVIQQFEGKITVEEYVGSELEIIADDVEDVPEKAKGLKPIGRGGATDNTGIGLEVNQSGNTITIKGVTKQASQGEYLFKIPKGLKCKIDYTSPFANDDVFAKGFSSELEISTLNGGIVLENVTGPLLLNAINGEIKIKFNTINQNAPISVTAINGEIDVEIPANTPANLNLSTIMGEIYTDFDINFEKKNAETGLTYIGGGRDIEGKINNGGVDILLKTINNNIYLRKK